MKLRPKLAEFPADSVHEGLRSFSRSGGATRDFISMLIGAGQKERGTTEQAMIARQCIRQYGCVGCPDVGFRIDIVNRSRNIKRLCHDVGLLFGGFFFRGRLRRREIFFAFLDVSSGFF